MPYLKGRGRLPTEGQFRWEKELVALALIISAITALRSPDFGTDYPKYYDFYDYIYHQGRIPVWALVSKEWFWNQLNYWSASARVPAVVFFGLVTLITWSLFIAGSYRYQNLLPLMLYFAITSGIMYFTLNGLRQSISVMIFFYSIRFITEKRLGVYVGLIFVASIFHTSALITIPLYFLSFLPFNRNVAITAYGLSLVFIGTFSLQTVADIVSPYLKYIPSFDENYGGYLDFGTEISQTEANILGLGFVIKSAFAFWIIFSSENTLKKYPGLKIYFNLFLIYSVFSTVFFAINVIDRALMYFLISFPMVAGATVISSTGRISRPVSILFLMVYVLMFVASTMRALASLGQP